MIKPVRFKAPYLSRSDKRDLLKLLDLLDKVGAAWPFPGVRTAAALRTQAARRLEDQEWTCFLELR